MKTIPRSHWPAAFCLLAGLCLAPSARAQSSNDWQLIDIAGLPGVFWSSVAWGDYDNDGRLDFFIAGLIESNRVSQLWRNTGSGFTNVPIPGLRGDQYGTVAWGDYDNDGRLDFLLTGTTNGGISGAISQLWRNTGGGFTNVPIPGLPRVFNSSVAWGDYDNDGRLDFLLTGTTNGSNSGAISQVWRNTGNGFANKTPAAAPDLARVYYSSVAWADYDNDGRMDFLITGLAAGGGVAELWRNTGDGFTNVPIPGLPGVYSGSVAWGDADNDGRLDFLLAGRSSTGLVSQVWRNTGSGFTNVPIRALPGVFAGSVAWGDADNDGRLDFLITGTSNGNAGVSQLWRNNLSLSNSPPTAPTGLLASFLGPYLALSWNPATDTEMPNAGLTYNVRLGTTPGGSDVLAPTSLSNGRRLLPKSGNAQHTFGALISPPQLGQTYYWSVQAVDAAFAGSPFASEQHFTLAFSPTFAGDTNNDDVVDQNELNTVLNNYWQTSPPNMQSVVSPSNTVFRFGLENLSSLNFHVLATTNVALPLANWQDIGPATLSYQFTDPDATNYAAQFYQLAWP